MKAESTYIAEAIEKLRPNSSFAVANTIDSLYWNPSNSQDQPTNEEIETEVLKIKAIEEYQTKRKLEYPPVEEYLDAVVKGDLAQQQAYIDACLAVKTKYPKPEGV
jgi:hypothetical protein